MDSYEAKARFSNTIRLNNLTWGEQFDQHRALSLSHAPTDCLLGDSHVERLFRPPLLPLSQQRLPGWKNLGIGGDKAQHILWRAQQGGLPHNLRRIIIFSGSNNIGAGNSKSCCLTANTIIMTIQHLLITHPHAQIALVGIMPQANIKKCESAIIVNNIVKHKLPHSVLYIPPPTVFTNTDSSQNSRYFQDDVHLNSLGYSVLLDELIPFTASPISSHCHISSRAPDCDSFSGIGTGSWMNPVTDDYAIGQLELIREAVPKKEPFSGRQQLSPPARSFPMPPPSWTPTSSSSCWTPPRTTTADFPPLPSRPRPSHPPPRPSPQVPLRLTFRTPQRPPPQPSPTPGRAQRPPPPPRPPPTSRRTRQPPPRRSATPLRRPPPSPPSLRGSCVTTSIHDQFKHKTAKRTPPPPPYKHTPPTHPVLTTSTPSFPSFPPTHSPPSSSPPSCLPTSSTSVCPSPVLSHPPPSSHPTHSSPILSPLHSLSPFSSPSLSPASSSSSILSSSTASPAHSSLPLVTPYATSNPRKLPVLQNTKLLRKVSFLLMLSIFAAGLFSSCPINLSHNTLSYPQYVAYSNAKYLQANLKPKGHYRTNKLGGNSIKQQLKTDYIIQTAPQTSINYSNSPPPHPQPSNTNTNKKPTNTNIRCKYESTNTNLRRRIYENESMNTNTTLLHSDMTLRYSYKTLQSPFRANFHQKSFNNGLLIGDYKFADYRYSNISPNIQCCNIMFLILNMYPKHSPKTPKVAPVHVSSVMKGRIAFNTTYMPPSNICAHRSQIKPKLPQIEPNNITNNVPISMIPLPVYAIDVLTVNHLPVYNTLQHNNTTLHHNNTTLQHSNMTLKYSNTTLQFSYNTLKPPFGANFRQKLFNNGLLMTDYKFANYKYSNFSPNIQCCNIMFLIFNMYSKHSPSQPKTPKVVHNHVSSVMKGKIAFNTTYMPPPNMFAYRSQIKPTLPHIEPNNIIHNVPIFTIPLPMYVFDVSTVDHLSVYKTFCISVSCFLNKFYDINNILLNFYGRHLHDLLVNSLLLSGFL